MYRVIFTALKEGTVTVRAMDGNTIADTLVSITANLLITAEPAELNIPQNSDAELSFTVKSVNNTNDFTKAVKWEIEADDETVVSYEQPKYDADTDKWTMKVTGLKSGETTSIKATAKYEKQIDGKTILMALFLLLVAVVVSVVIITAAATAAHQLNDNKEAQQAYLTVSSAAELFRDETEGKKYEHILKTYTKNSEGVSDKPSEVNEIRPEGSFRGLLTEISKAIIADNALNNGSDLYNKETAINVNNSGSSSYSFDQVNVKIYIQSISSNYYNMDISFEAAGKNKDEQGYKLNLNLPVTKSEQSISGITEDGNYSVMTTTTTVTFGKGTVTRPGIITDGGTNP